ncbi:ATP-binding cassette domain-containing protein [Halomonas urumqiensis]|uniref:Phosphonate ABC transporter ATP-binding protein n=1 Tax=Halomonas urumqiensis TaxID=1684789 RepID=A0A2N7UHD9_9GAMM|nr:ATP-binding cassette domain-containing protein [Halomonas urumqiensis]PMR79876.1 phosphonate ABC transporter ATP-binding protein [Halomonas urumqiensis]PTB02098.1 phosphonate ABC transporter ATP-binding protein [Halomonas urumqiensis]GHE21544.1 phosphonates import ATP-binding protein PhnC 1 [Halomonas urumqiensis]
MVAGNRPPLVGFAGEDLGYPRKRQHDQVVLPNLTLELHEGERIALLGESGAGKSTLLAALRERLCREAAWCPQQHGLVGQLSVYHNIYMGRLPEHSALANLWNLVHPLKRPWRDVNELCELLGLGGLAKRPVSQLSGGQRQRVAIGRALYQQRTLFLGDEPLASVDPHQALRLLALIDERHATTVIALHQRELALTHFDRVWGLRGGQLVIDAPASELTLGDLDALYPDANDQVTGSRDASNAWPTQASDMTSLPCSRGRL